MHEHCSGVGNAKALLRSVYFVKLHGYTLVKCSSLEVGLTVQTSTVDGEVDRGNPGRGGPLAVEAVAYLVGDF